MSPRNAFVLAAFAVAALAAAAPASAQDSPPAPPAGDAPVDRNPEKARWIEETRGRAAKLEDADAKGAIAHLVELWNAADITEATKKPIPDTLVRFASQFDRTEVAVAAVDALAALGADAGAKPLRDLLERGLDAKKQPLDVCFACLRGLKKLADPSKATTGLLVKLLQRKEAEVVGKVGDALSGYRDAPGKLRRELMEDVIKVAESVFQASRDGKDTAAVARWSTISGGMMSALNALSGQNFADPLAARRWYNDNKKDLRAWG